MSFSIVAWVVLGVAAVAVVACLRWAIHSFKRWPPTEDEARSRLWLWARRGGGDM